MVLRADIKKIYDKIYDKIYKNKDNFKTLLKSISSKVIHSSQNGKVKSYIANLNEEITYQLFEYKRIETNIFSKFFTFPVLIFRKQYDYPFSDKYPKVPNELLNKAKQILENKSIENNFLTIQENNQENNEENNILYKITKETKRENNKDIEIANYVIKIKEYIFYNDSDQNTVWVFKNTKNSVNNQEEPRLKTFMYLTNNKILSLIKKVLEILKLFNPQKHRLYSSTYSGEPFNSFHLKIINFKDYQLPILDIGINQTSEVRSTDVNNIIRIMNEFPNFYKEYSNSGKYEWFSQPYAQFLQM